MGDVGRGWLGARVVFSQFAVMHYRLLALGCVFAVGCRNAPAAELPQAVAEVPQLAATTDSAAKTWIEMRNVDLRVLGRAHMRVRQLHGEVISTKPGVIPILDTTTSFKIRITGGTVALSGPSLSILLNEYVFAYKGSPLRDLEVKTEGDHIVQTGIMHKGVDIRFKLKASLSLMEDGKIRLHPSEVEILGVNGLRLMNALGLELDDMLDLKGSRGASVKDNDIFLEPTKIVPPPAIEGRLASIRVEGPDVVQDFVRLPDDSVFSGSVKPDTAVTNAVYFRGGRIRFGKLSMIDTDLLILDGDPSDPLDLYLDKYNVQLVAGTSRTMANLGLRVVFPDFDDLPESRTARRSR
jgi:hypothetical protein